MTSSPNGKIPAIKEPRRVTPGGPPAAVRITEELDGTVVAVANLGWPIGELLGELAKNTTPGHLLVEAHVDRRHRRLTLVAVPPRP